jgi:hypothetical protein
MRFTRIILLAVVAVAFSTYAFDCLAMSTTAAAMHCCDSMHCSSHGRERSQECCKTMPSMRAPFLRPASVHGPSFWPVFVTVLAVLDASQVLNSPSIVLAAQCHAPPVTQPATPAPLRI